jgi:hypothetical protein
MGLPLANAKYRKLAKTVSTLLGFSALSVWLFYFYVVYQYDGSRPVVPDVASGRVVEQNEHGHVVYLTAAEHGRLTKIAIVAGSLVFACFLIRGLFGDGFFDKKAKLWEVRRW